MRGVRVNNIETGENIRKMREALGLRQKDVAAEAGVRQGSIGGYELGRTIPNTEAALALSELFHVSVNELISYEVIE